MIIKTNPKAVFKKKKNATEKALHLNQKPKVSIQRRLYVLSECTVLHCNTIENPLNSWLATSARLRELQSFIRDTSLRPHTNKQKPNDSLRYKWQRPMQSRSVWGREREKDEGRGIDKKQLEEVKETIWKWMRSQLETVDDTERIRKAPQFLPRLGFFLHHSLLLRDTASAWWPS